MVQKSTRAQFLIVSLITGNGIVLALMGALNLTGATQFRLNHAIAALIGTTGVVAPGIAAGYALTGWDPPAILLPKLTTKASGDAPPGELEAMMQRLSTRGQHPLAAALLARQLRGEVVSVEEVQAVERMIQHDLELRRMGGAEDSGADPLDLSGLSDVPPSDRPGTEDSLFHYEALNKPADSLLPKGGASDPWDPPAPALADGEGDGCDWLDSQPNAAVYTPQSPPPSPTKIGQHLPHYMDI